MFNDVDSKKVLRKMLDTQYDSFLEVSVLTRNDINKLKNTLNDSDIDKLEELNQLYNQLESFENEINQRKNDIIYEEITQNARNLQKNFSKINNDLQSIRNFFDSQTPLFTPAPIDETVTKEESILDNDFLDGEVDVVIENNSGIENVVQELINSSQNPWKIKFFKKKSLLMFGNVLFYSVMFFTLLFVIFLGSLNPTVDGVPSQIFGYSVLQVSSASMEPSIPVGSVLLIRQIDPSSVSIGDIVTVNMPDNNSVTHRVYETHFSEIDNDLISFRLKGDANFIVDEDLYFPEQLIGRYIFSSFALGVLIEFVNFNIISLFFIIVLVFMTRVLLDLRKRLKRNF